MPSTPPPPSPVPVPVPDAEIEALNLAPVAKAAAYALKKAQPSVKFTSGRRGLADQVRAMAGNVVLDRSWIGTTYKDSPLCRRLQAWVNSHPQAKTKDDIAAGLRSVFTAATQAEVGSFSKHLSGEAFDVQPVVPDTNNIMATIRGLDGLELFLDKEGQLLRWHAQFKTPPA